MIDYKQLATGEPPDVEVATDDSNAEMADFALMIKECEFEIKLPDSRDEDGIFRFVLPGEVVAEFAEMVYDYDDGLLEKKMDEWNEQTMERAEKTESESG